MDQVWVKYGSSMDQAWVKYGSTPIYLWFLQQGNNTIKRFFWRKGHIKVMTFLFVNKSVFDSNLQTLKNIL